MIGYLITERTAEAACSKANVAPSTLWRWMKTRQFVDEYRKIRQDVLENTVSRLQGLTHQAIDTLERNLSCENPATEIRAAQIVLDQAFRGLETLDVAIRLDHIEAVLAAEEIEI